MAFAQSTARPIPGAIATAGVDERVAFIKRTYAHLFGAIIVFAAFLGYLVQSPLGEKLARWAFGGSAINWLLFLGAFMVVGHFADKWARSAHSLRTQYIGLGVYVFAEALLFTPFLWFVANSPRLDGAIGTSAMLTVLIFGGLTATVFFTRKDFSFLRGALSIGMFASIGLIIASAMFGFELGVFFSVAMIALAAGYILYTTSQILAHYKPTQHVAASLALFANVALLFWYVLRLVIALRD